MLYLGLYSLLHFFRDRVTEMAFDINPPLSVPMGRHLCIRRTYAALIAISRRGYSFFLFTIVTPRSGELFGTEGGQWKFSWSSKRGQKCVKICQDNTDEQLYIIIIDECVCEVKS